MTRNARRVLLALALAALAASLGGCHHRAKIVDLQNESLYEQGQKMLDRRHFLESIKVLGDVGMNAPVSEDLDPLVKLALADAYYFQTGSVTLVEAQSRYEQFLNFYPLHPKARYARFMIGVCLLDQADSPDNDQEFSLKALNHFQAMVDELPADDPFGRAARSMLLRAQDRLSEHEWIVGRFYLEKKHLEGAAGRFAELTDKYPGSRRRPQALYELATVRLALGQHAAAREALDRLAAEHPGSDWARKGAELKTAIPETAAPAGKGATGR